MKQIRQGVFETNSSSVHSLSILNRDSFISNYPLQGFFGEFGWEHNMLNSPTEKLSYVLTTIAYFAGVVNVNKKIEKDKAIGMFLSEGHFVFLNEAIKEHTGEGIYIDWDKALCSEWNPFGYIDHQSFEYGVPDALEMFWSEDEETFKKNMIDLIFNSKYSIITDNDND